MMPSVPDGYTHIERATEKWRRGNRTWWFERVRDGEITGYKLPGLSGTFLRDEEVERYLQPRPIERDGKSQVS